MLCYVENVIAQASLFASNFNYIRSVEITIHKKRANTESERKCEMILVLNMLSTFRMEVIEFDTKLYLKRTPLDQI